MAKCKSNQKRHKTKFGCKNISTANQKKKKTQPCLPKQERLKEPKRKQKPRKLNNESLEKIMPKKTRQDTYKHDFSNRDKNKINFYKKSYKKQRTFVFGVYISALQAVKRAVVKVGQGTKNLKSYMIVSH